MSKARAIISKPNLFLKRHPQYQKALIATFIVVGGFILFFAINGSQLPNQVWLPTSNRYMPNDETIFNLPVKSETVITKYGRGIRYTTTADWSTEYKDSKPWTTIYEFRSSPLLKSSSCPNITNAETLLPSECKKIGTFHDQPVYTMHRSLPSGATECFVKLGQTFIFIKSGGDGGEGLDHINAFAEVPHDKVSSYLANNSKRVNAIKAKQQAQKEATDKNNALAYTRLDFTPAIPTNPPSDWQLNTNATNTHPNMINLDYTNSNKQYVSVHSGKLSNFIIGIQCGPSPGYSMENLACHKVTGTDYYEATLYDEQNDFVRYLYRPVGDCLVISQIFVYADGGKRPGFPVELARVQDIITSGAQPTDKTSLKDSTYHKLYY
jgi:hypothetical protein